MGFKFSLQLLILGCFAQAQVNFPISRLPFNDVIPIKDTPLLISITLDDAITPFASFLFSKIAKTKDPHTGCNLKATFYVSIEGTNTKCEYVQGLRQGGHEIGTHTLNHIALPDIAQIKGAVDWLSTECGVPAEEMRGFRTPFLNWDDSTLQNLHQLGFLYDSSIGPVDHTANQRGRNHTWPFTLEQPNIDQFQTVKPSVQISPAPGLWEIPMWSLYDANNQAEIPMDYPNPKGGNAVIADLIHPNFLKRYNGNRAPLGLFFHASWLVANGEVFAAWIQEIMDTYEDVFFVTSYEILQWMQNPVPASQYVQSCPEQKLCFAPRDTGCLFGKFNGQTCQCDCTAPYCRGPDGACTEYVNCPVGPTAPTSPAASPVSSPLPPYSGSGCCSGSFKDCDAKWCGETEAACKSCGVDFTWLSNGPLSNCNPRTWGCSKDTDCCNGLKCSGSSCVPGTRSPASSPASSPITSPASSPASSPVTSPASAPAGSPVTSPASAPAGSPVTSPASAPAGSPVTSPASSPVESSPVASSPTGCCSSSFKNCDASWCGTTEATCNSCDGDFIWLANGALTNCNAVTWGCQTDRDCCNGLKCKGNSCTVGVSSPTPANPPVSKPVSAPVSPPTTPLFGACKAGRRTRGGRS